MDENLIALLVVLVVQRVAQLAQTFGVGGHLQPAQLCRFAEAGDARHVEGAGAHAALVTAAVDDRRQQHARVAPADVERADAFRPVHLVRADRGQIDLQIDDVERPLAGTLLGVGVQQDTLPLLGPAVAPHLVLRHCPGLFVLRFVCFCGEGDRLEAGQRIGLIRFGSLVDVYLPKGVFPLVALGQRAIAGETVFADLGSTEGERAARKS